MKDERCGEMPLPSSGTERADKKLSFTALISAKYTKKMNNILLKL